MADESIWKKEISFGRKRKEEGEKSEPEQTDSEATSIWKKEINFGRKKKSAEPEPVVEEPVAEDPAPQEETWTRAVSFGGKAEPEPVAEEPAPQEETWTRAVSFGRKSEPEPVAEESGAEEPVAEEQERAAREPAPQ